VIALGAGPSMLLSMRTSQALLERALALCIDQGQLRRHAERIPARLDLASARTQRDAGAAGTMHLCRRAGGPPGQVCTGVDTDALSQRMLGQGYQLALGGLFHARREPGR
jgi:hypothetical protein